MLNRIPLVIPGTLMSSKHKYGQDPNQLPLMIRLFRVFIPKSVMALLVLDALMVFTCFLIAAYFVSAM